MAQNVKTIYDLGQGLNVPDPAEQERVARGQLLLAFQQQQQQAAQFQQQLAAEAARLQAQLEQAKESRAFQGQESALDRALRERMQGTSQQFQSQERGLDRQFQQGMAQDARSFQGQENAQDRLLRSLMQQQGFDFQRGMAQEDRDFRSGENQLNRQFQSGMAQDARAFQGEQSALDRALRSVLQNDQQAFLQGQAADDRGFRMSMTQMQQALAQQAQQDELFNATLAGMPALQEFVKTGTVPEGMKGEIERLALLNPQIAEKLMSLGASLPEEDQGLFGAVSEGLVGATGSGEKLRRAFGVTNPPESFEQFSNVIARRAQDSDYLPMSLATQLETLRAAFQLFGDPTDRNISFRPVGPLR